MNLQPNVHTYKPNKILSRSQAKSVNSYGITLSCHTDCTCLGACLANQLDLVWHIWLKMALDMMECEMHSPTVKRERPSISYVCSPSAKTVAMGPGEFQYLMVFKPTTE